MYLHSSSYTQKGCFYKYEEALQSQRERIRRESLEELLQRIGKEDTPLNIAIIGMPGCGKSSFINTLIASITGEWRSYAMAGSFGGMGEHKTNHIAMLSIFCYVSSCQF